MSCNGCRVLRKGCGDSCILRPCLQWIDTPESQGHATLFVAKFFGRADLMSFISAVPYPQRPALFQSLLFEACGRTINPVNGAVGLLATGNWQVCQAAVQTVLSGGVPRPIPPEMLASCVNSSSYPVRGGGVDSVTTTALPTSALSYQQNNHQRYYHQPPMGGGGGVCSKRRMKNETLSFESVGCSDTTAANAYYYDNNSSRAGGGGGDDQRKLLNLFV